MYRSVKTFYFLLYNIFIVNRYRTLMLLNHLEYYKMILDQMDNKPT